MDIKRAVKEQEIWDKEQKAAKLEEEAKKLVPPRFYIQIHVFRKKTSERMPTRKMQNYTIDIKEGFVLRKQKVYPLSREEKQHEFIDKQLRKGYIRPSKSL